MDIQRIKELALANGFKLKEQAGGNMDLNAYVYDFANAVEREAKAQADQKIKLLLCDEHLKKCESPTGVFNSQYPDEEPCLICLANQAKAQAVPEGFVLVPKTDVYDYYIANHLKGTTCSVDVSELTGNDGDRIYGKLRQYDCLGSDGNTLIYDLESSNFKLGKRTGNTGDYVLVPKEPTEEMIKAGRDERRDFGTVASTYKAMIEAQEQAND